jgi:hypothetical protein
MHDGLTVHQVNFYMYNKCWANFTNKKLQAEPRKPTALLWRLVVLDICYYSYTSSYLKLLYLCTYAIHDEFVRYNLKVLHHQCVGDCRLITIQHTYWSDTVTIYLHNKYYMSNIDIFVNFNWVDTQWQWYSTVHIYTQTIHRTTQLIWEECGPCPVLASYTLAFALQVGKKHGQTSIRVAEECQLARWKQNIEKRTYIKIRIHKHNKNM